MDTPHSKGIAAKLADLAQRPVPITRRQWLVLAGTAAAVGGLSAVWHFKRFHLRNAIALNLRLPTPFDSEPEISRYRADADAIRALFPRKAEPAPGEWLAMFDEPGQSFNQYMRRFAPASREANGEILILPFGKFDSRQLRNIAEAVAMVEMFYQRPVTILPAEPVPPLAEDQRRKRGNADQLYTLPILDLLKPRVPKTAVGLLALTPLDVTAGPDWNFVFGQASLVDRVGVWSLHRLAAPDVPAERQLRRVAQVALHELGHMFGIDHCTAYTCCMNGYNSMKEADASPLAFCPECDAKVWWRFHLDPIPRYRRLAQFATGKGLARDADLWTRCAQALEEARR
jgi:archaemetzincin